MSLPRKSIAAIIAGLVALSGAQALAAPPANLSPQDYFEIQQLYSEYAYAVDTGDGIRRAGVFTPDAAITSNLTDHKPGGMIDMVTRTGRIGRPVRPQGGHTMANIVIRPTADGAVGRAYAIVGTKLNSTGQIVGSAAVYNDVLVRTATGWRIKARDIWLDSETNSPFHPGRCAHNPCR